MTAQSSNAKPIVILVEDWAGGITRMTLRVMLDKNKKVVSNRDCLRRRKGWWLDKEGGRLYPRSSVYQIAQEREEEETPPAMNAVSLDGLRRGGN